MNKIKIVDIGQSAFWIDVTGEATSTGEVKGIAFRADMDGLPLNEETGVEYTSTHPGKAHSCGHDGHMTIMTCFLEYILERLNLIPSNFNLRFLYQPAEEILAGAKYLIEKNCLEGIHEIYGLHNISIIPLGMIGIVPGTIMAASTEFEISIKGIGGHGSAPDKCHSPITCGSEIVNKLNQITSQEVDSSQRSVLTIGTFKSGETCNVIPENAFICGSIRTVNIETAPIIKEKIKCSCSGIGLSNSCQVDVNFPVNCSVTSNDEELYNKVMLPAISKTNFTKISSVLPALASEDLHSTKKKYQEYFFF